MSAAPTLRTLIHDASNDLCSAEPERIAVAVLARIPEAEYGSALLEALTLLSAGRKQPAALRERMMRNSEQIGTCLVWRGRKNRGGYGLISVGPYSPNPSGRKVPVHRVSYLTFVGPIPDGMNVDHLCHSRNKACQGGPSCLHRACWNPDHLEAVTPGENTRRGRAGKHGNQRRGSRAAPAATAT